MAEDKLFDLPDPPPAQDGAQHLIRPANDEERRALNTSAYISAVLALAEALAATFTGSLALMAIAIDSMEDAAHYGLASLTAGQSKRYFQAGLVVIAVLAIAAYVWIGWAAFAALAGKTPPNPWIMIGMAVTSLIVNLVCAWRLRGLRHDTGDMAFIWRETRWDFLADLGVLLAAMAISDWAIRWPDTAAGLAIAAVNLFSIVRMLWAAMRAAR